MKLVNLTHSHCPLLGEFGFDSQVLGRQPLVSLPREYETSRFIKTKDPLSEFAQWFRLQSFQAKDISKQEGSYCIPPMSSSGVKFVDCPSMLVR